MLLAVDVGNTDIKLGVFAGSELRGTWRWATDRARMADEYAAYLGWLLAHHELSFSAIDRVVLSSVVPSLTATFQQLSRRYFDLEPLYVSANLPIGIRLAVDNPQEVGGDRIANAVAAIKLHGGPAIVVDFGTATNFDVVSADGAFVGGSFAPGLLTALEGLLSRAARLQRFDLVAPGRAIGTNTVACLQSGTIYGYVALVEGLVARITSELGADPLVIGTGGLVDVIAAETRAISLVDRDLTLKGLRLIADGPELASGERAGGEPRAASPGSS
jgi:type III pantothenate kinase